MSMEWRSTSPLISALIMSRVGRRRAHGNAGTNWILLGPANAGPQPNEKFQDTELVAAVRRPNRAIVAGQGGPHG